MNKCVDEWDAAMAPLLEKTNKCLDEWDAAMAPLLEKPLPPPIQCPSSTHASWGPCHKALHPYFGQKVDSNINECIIIRPPSPVYLCEYVPYIDFYWYRWHLINNEVALTMRQMLKYL
jgi:hypothetical protein